MSESTGFFGGFFVDVFFFFFFFFFFRAHLIYGDQLLNIFYLVLLFIRFYY